MKRIAAGLIASLGLAHCLVISSIHAQQPGKISRIGGPNLIDMVRRSARPVDKILKGAKPGDFAVEHPTRFELVTNVKAANAVGLNIPQSVLFRADRVIQ